MKQAKTPLKAIRAKCIDCCGHQVKEVKRCPVLTCALWPYRMGRGYEDPLKPGFSVILEDDPTHATHVSALEEVLVET
jgi:hypothetical protein